MSKALESSKIAKQQLGPLMEELVEIMHTLRSDRGCPWDREQTHITLLPHLIEEAYEVIEAVNRDDLQGLRDELGDLVLHILFHSQLATEEDHFTIIEVLTGIRDKLIHRHPHVFGDKKDVTDAEAVKKVWGEQKRQEGKQSILDGVPRAMPAMQRAWRLSDKASTVGFDWPNIDGVWEKVDEEMQELKEAVTSKSGDAVLDEVGDLFFSLINICRYLKIDPELALQRTNSKFTRRFQTMEKNAATKGQKLANLGFEELEELWQQAKNTS